MKIKWWMRFVGLEREFIELASIDGIENWQPTSRLRWLVFGVPLPWDWFRPKGAA